MSSAKEVQAAFEKLSDPEKEKFALWYEKRQTDRGPGPEVDELLTGEIERRLEEIRSGKVKLIPGEQVMAEIRRRYGIEE